MRYARENGVPYLGICLGMQVAVIEFARNVAGPRGRAQHRVRPQTPHPVIALITEWQDQQGAVETRTEQSNLGGTMRLGAQDVPISQPGTLAHALYGTRRDPRAPPPPLRVQQPLPASG